jgi:hypothetical protein
MTIPYRTFVALGVAVGLLGAGYAFAPRPGAAALSTAPVAPKAPVASTAAPGAPAKPTSTLVVNRAPVPLATPMHHTYYAPKEADASVQTASATSGPTPGTPAIGGGNTDGGLPPASIDPGTSSAPGEAKSGDGSQAKAAIELDGYKNVRGLEKAPGGTWRGRAMRGRTEIAIRVDAAGNVSAE